MSHKCQACGETELRGRRWVCESCKTLVAQQRSSGPSVDYSRGRAELPGLAPQSDMPYRAPVSHDRERWLRELDAEARREELGDNETTSWDAVMARQQTSDRVVNFGGPREPQDSVLGRRAGRPISDPAAAGILYGEFGDPWAAAARGEVVQRPLAPKPDGVQRKWAFIH